jgi:tetratricopeptide (TPR) repeat protein
MEALQSQAGSAIAGDARIETLADSRPPLVPAILVRALVKEQAGDLAAARAIYESLLKRFPLCALADASLARVLSDPAIKDIPKAFEHASKARAAYPGDPSVARLLGQIAFIGGDFSRAAQLLEEASAGFPSDAALYFDLGFALQNLKQATQARAALGRAVSLAPNSPRADEARKALAKLQ